MIQVHTHNLYVNILLPLQVHIFSMLSTDLSLLLGGQAGAGGDGETSLALIIGVSIAITVACVFVTLMVLMGTTYFILRRSHARKNIWRKM